MSGWGNVLKGAAVGVSIATLALGVASPAAGQTAGDFTYAPTSGPVGTVIDIHGECPASVGGDAIALYRVPDGALVDARVGLGNPPSTRPWDTSLTVKNMAETSTTPAGSPDSPVLAGAYEIRLFCDIGSSFQSPNRINEPEPPTPRSDAEVIKPFTVTSSTTSSTTTTTSLPSSTPVPTATTSVATASPSTVAPGGNVTVTGGGMAPSADLTLTLFSDPISLGTARADASGNFSVVVTIPADTSPGEHRLVVSGRGPQGEVHESVATLTVGTSGGNALVRTGPDTGGMMQLAIGLCALGVMLVGLATYRFRQVPAWPARRRLWR